jgi:hypothetical protein
MLNTASAPTLFQQRYDEDARVQHLPPTHPSEPEPHARLDDKPEYAVPVRPRG